MHNLTKKRLEDARKMFKAWSACTDSTDNEIHEHHIREIANVLGVNPKILQRKL